MLEITRKHYLFSVAFAYGVTTAFKQHFDIKLSCNPELRYYYAGLIYCAKTRESFDSSLGFAKESGFYAGTSSRIVDMSRFKDIYEKS